MERNLEEKEITESPIENITVRTDNSDSQLPNTSTTELVMKKKTEENLPLRGNLTSEEHIYSYDTDKNRRSVPNTPGRKNFKISCIALGIVGLYLLGFYIFLLIRGGYSDSDFNDLDANCRYAMVILSIFVLFMAAAGYSGAYTNWKPIILTFSVLVSTGLLGHLYVAKKCLDAYRFTSRDMAISWWDVYTDYVRAEIQDKYQCCGYKDYKDLPVASLYCLSNEVDTVLQYSEGIKDPADVKKNDSYRKKFGTADSVGGPTAGGKANNPAPAANADAGNAGAANAGADNAGAANANAGAGNAGAANAGAAKAGGAAAAANPAPAADPVDQGAADPGIDAGVAAIGKRSDVFRFEETLRRRQVAAAAEANQIKQELAILQTEGCERKMVEKIQSKLKVVYIFNYALSLVYIASCVLSLIYWQNMRKEKEFDEFA